MIYAEIIVDLSAEAVDRRFTYAVPEGITLSPGMLVTVPIPAEWSMDADYINGAIDKALREADEQGVAGKEITPFLLARIKDITGGSSLDANIHLVFNNVKTAARIASQL